MRVELTNGTVLNLGNIKGADGIGVSKAEINVAGELLLTYTNGETDNLGVIMGADGADGTGIKSVTLSADGELIITMSDNSVVNLGNIKGAKGDKGDTGEKGTDGKDGRGIANMEIIDGELIVTYTDDPQNPVNVGSVGNGGTGSEITDGNYVYVLLPDGTYGIKASPNFALKNVTIPGSYNGISVTQIMDNGFENCDTITSLTLPNSLVKIGQHAFTNCVGLTTLTIPDNVNFIGAFAFYGTGLTSVTLPEPDTWTAGTDGFSYWYFSLDESNGSEGSIMNYWFKTFSLANIQNAAQALTQPVEVQALYVYDRPSVKNYYVNKNWYSQDWTRAE